MKTIKKAQKGTSLGMKSVKAGFDKNPGAALKKQAATAIAMKKAGKAPKMAKKGASMKKCKYGCK